MTQPEIDRLQHQDSWRLWRIMAEIVEGFEVLGELGVPLVTVFGSARLGPESPYYPQALLLGQRLAEAGFGVVTGGGPGLMEAANRGAYNAGGVSVGLNIQLPHEQRANPFQTHSLSFRYFFARKLMLVRYAQAFVVMPGGFGSLDELAEVLVLVQTGKVHPFPIFALDRVYWRGLLEWMQGTMIPAGVVDAKDLELITLVDTPEEVLDALTGNFRNNF
ncbi:MAG: TIGR00730 family Rossman fold protein [Meiothermus sp.]|uniref:LOG family protein n=1 Tax=Meiothermus sp. TaxID=1955249 RepID=UPI00298F06C6|nr:TIGR00730 family Rossman fold protein [Meiothermus sp.]MCX7601108.1 TIGR00730 family Rossman fold protein [Meiothermus sp.]MDW8425685.1 TIGR00730 family Rossman fold protein [Meiothermus sp.]